MSRMSIQSGGESLLAAAAETGSDMKSEQWLAWALEQERKGRLVNAADMLEAAVLQEAEERLAVS